MFKDKDVEESLKEYIRELDKVEDKEIIEDEEKKKSLLGQDGKPEDDFELGNREIQKLERKAVHKIVMCDAFIKYLNDRGFNEKISTDTLCMALGVIWSETK